MWRFWLILGVVFYPVTIGIALLLSVHLFSRLDRFSALASAFIVLVVLWLYLLPRDLSWALAETEILSPRIALPVTAYLGGLIVAAILMSFTPARR